MTSEERREKRYQNRRRARGLKRDEQLSQYDDYDKIISSSALVAGCRQSQKGVTWKASVQRYLMNLLRFTSALHKDLVFEKDVSQGFIEFELSERGKRRHIKSVHFRERCVQRSLCDNALVPVLKNSLIYDNGASLKDRGIHFSIGRVVEHLHRYYRANEFSNRGYVLSIDFSKYFDNILHPPIYDMLDRAFHDKRIVQICRHFIDPFGEKSVGIGSQISQIIAIAYPNSIDHYIKQELGIKYYGRYMDDSYIIHPNKEYLRYCLSVLIEKYAELGIKINPKKTQISKLPSGMTFLKARFVLTDSGKVVIKPCAESIARMRRRLKKFKKLFDAGAMGLEDIRCSYRSWRGYVDHMDAFRSIQRMDALFISLYHQKP